MSQNGGPTATHAPVTTGPAINAGLNADAPAGGVDQRGQPRIVGGQVDIGAVESDVQQVVNRVVGTPDSDLIHQNEVSTGVSGRLTAGPDVVVLLGGNDLVDGSPGQDVIDGGAGYDRVDYTRSGAAVDIDLVRNFQRGGDAERDQLVSIEQVTGSGFADGLRGDGAANSFVGGGGGDVLEGRDGNDVLRGGRLNDLLRGGDGIDGLDGGTGDDRLEGGAGDDFLAGAEGLDTLLGGAGVDRLLGGDGNDLLNGGAGRDLMVGGAGADLFVFGQDALSGLDTIRDFDPTQGDAIRLALPGLGGDGTLAIDAARLLLAVSGGDTLLLADLAGTGNVQALARLEKVTGLTLDAVIDNILIA